MQPELCSLELTSLNNPMLVKLIAVSCSCW